ncbi:MAG: DUF503 domain-containing protein [FCB group bacterium]|nr:DUF503 domain-containing protein [FCB group bacterium]
MIVTAVQVKMLIHESHSLKAKRGVVKSIKQRIRNKFNVSIAEVGDLERHNYAELGISAVGNETRFTEEQIGKAVNFIESDFRVEVIEVSRII